MGSFKLSVLVYFWFSYNTIFLSSVNQLIILVERQQFLEFPVTSRYILGHRGIRGGVRGNNANCFLLRING